MQSWILRVGLVFWLMQAIVAKADTMGAGISVGTGSGLSLFYQQEGDTSRAYQGLVNFDTDGHFSVHADILFPLVVESDPHWDATWGLGGIVGNYHRASLKLAGKFDKDADDFLFGVRIPFNIVYYIPNTPLQIGAEVAPSFVIADHPYGYIHVALIVRLIFGV